MKYKILILFFLVLHISVSAQDSIRIKKNKVSVELLGSCGYFSFNYERVLKRIKNFEFSAEVGYSILYFNKAFEYCLFPVHLNITYTKYQIEPEIDLGITNVIDFTPDPRSKTKKSYLYSGPPPSPLYYINYTPRIGIKYNFNKKIFGKIMVIPVIRYINLETIDGEKYAYTIFVYWAGFNLGINF